jgi:hypothetical protein
LLVSNSTVGEIVDRVGIAVVEPDCGQVPARGVKIALFLQHSGVIEPRLDEAGIDLQRLHVGRFRLLVSCERAEAVGAVEGSTCISRVEREASLVERRRFLEAPVLFRVLGKREKVFQPVVVFADRQQHLAVEFAEQIAVAGVDRLVALNV